MERFTRVEGVAAGWLKNSGISGAETVGRGAETVGSYLVGRTTGPVGGVLLL